MENNESKINVWGAAAIMGFDEWDWTQAFLARTKYKSKIDQVIDFYWVPYCYKNNINQFLKYWVQPRHYPIVHDHFYMVLKSTWYWVEDFDYGKLQEDFTSRQLKWPWLDFKMKIENFSKQEEKQVENVNSDTMILMQEMMKEIQELKAKFLPKKE